MGTFNLQSESTLASSSTAPAEIYSSGRLIHGGSLAQEQTTDFRSQRQKSTDAFLYTLPNVIIGGFASVAESMPGTSDEGVDSLIKTMTPEGMYADYKSKQDGYALAGGLLAAVPVIFSVPKLMRAQSLYNKVEAVAGKRAASVLLPNKYSVSDRVKQFKNQVDVAAKKQTSTFTQETTQEINAAIKKNTATEFFDMMKIGVATDVGIYATQNNNDFLFPEEMSAVEIGLFYGLPNVVMAGAAGAVVRYQMKEVLREAGTVAATARNPGNMPINDATAVPGFRGIAATNNFLMANSKTEELKEVAGDALAVRNIAAQETVYAKNGMEQANLMAKESPYPGITGKFALSEGGFNTVNEARKLNPTVLGDVKSIEAGKQEAVNKVVKNYNNKVTGLQKELTQMEKSLSLEIKESPGYLKLVDEKNLKLKELEELQQLNFVKLNPDGSMEAAENAKGRFSEQLTGRTLYIEPGNLDTKLKKAFIGDLVKVKKKTAEEKDFSYAVKYAEDQDESLKYVQISSGLKLVDESYDALSPTGKLAAQTLLKKAAAEWTPEHALISLEGKSSHAEIDAALEIVQKFGSDSEAISKGFKLPEGINWEQMEMLSLSKKYDAYRKAVEVMGKESSDIIKLPESSLKTLDDILVELNLPNNGTGGMTPLVQLFENRRLQGVKTSLLTDFPNPQVLQKELEKIGFNGGDLTANYVVKSAANLRGTQYTTFDKPREPLLLVTKPVAEVNLMNRAELVAETLRQRDEIISKLNSGHGLIQGIVDTITRDPVRFKEAKNVANLVEGSQTHSDRFTQAMFGLANQTPTVAIDSIAGESKNFVDGYVSRMFKEHNETFNNLLSDKGALDYYAIASHQRGIGWRGTPDFEPVMEGDKLIGYKILLEDHPQNARMAKDYYGIDDLEEFKKTNGGMYMPTPKMTKDTPYAPLVLPELAAKTFMGMNILSQDARLAANTTREAVGMRPIPQQALHLPPKNLAAKEKKFLINEQTGELYSIAPGNTANQAAALAQEEIAIAKKRGIDLFIASDKEVEQFSLMQLNDPTKMIDYSTSFRQTGQATGKSFGQTIELGATVLQEQQASIIRQYQLASRVATSIVFDPEFRAAKVAAETSGMSATTLQKGTNTFEAYIRRGLGIKSGNDKQTIGKFYGAVEDIYDRLWQKAWDQKVSIFKGGQTAGQADTGFKNLNNSTGPEYNPFKDSIEFMENTMRIKPPQNMLKHSSTLSAVTGANLLRMGEIGLGVINIMSLPTLIPTVARALRPAKGEDLELWKAKNYAWASEIKEGEDFLWNPIRASISGTNFFFSKEGKNLMKEAHEKGHLWQKAVEQLNLAVEPTQSSWQRAVAKNVDRVSVIVDKTEEWSRGISYGVFYKLGRENLRLNHDTAMEFAHNQVNRVIGDFRPNNRPQVFQGAAGMPFGLFTTFAWNYLQRVFNYVEKGDFKTFFYQMGLQSAFFGAKSLPGFNAYVENFSSNYDGSENMVDRMQSSLGTSMTDAILFGSVGSLTGLAAYSRTEIGLPGSNYARTNEISSMAPAAGMISRAYQGMSESITSLKANDGFNGQQIAEIMGRTFPTSSVKGWIQTGLGYTVDSRGQLINENIDSATERFAKMSNIKTLREQLLVEEFARTRSIELAWKSRRARARKALRASYRNGKLESEALNQIAKDFLASNGNPDDFDNFITSEAEAALVNKGYLKALTLAKKASQVDQMMRMINILGNKEYE